MTATHIVVLMGGLSPERDVSLTSGGEIVPVLTRMGYRVTPLDMGRDVAAQLARLQPDIVYNALHGTYGEDGCIQGLLDIMGIPYTHSGVLASSIGMHKAQARACFMAAGIRCAPGIVYHRPTEALAETAAEPLPRPYVLKPLAQGSSVGVELVFPGDNMHLSQYAWPYGDTVLLEQYIPGREIHVAVLEGKALGAVEIRPHGRFYDYNAKYTAGQATHIMPAPLTDERYQEVLALAERAHAALGCRTLSRVDFRYQDTGEPAAQGFYILEINTHPGMTPLSLVPEIAAHAGITFEAILAALLRDARCGA